MDEVEELIIPKDLSSAFKTKAGSEKRFLALSKSVQKMYLHRLVMAKQETARAKRIEEIIRLLIE